MIYKEIAYEDLNSKNKLKILIVTATQLETEMLHKILIPLSDEESIITIIKDQQTYYLGRLGKYAIIHVQCSHMGATAEGASILTITNSFNDWIGVLMVIMVGICFGIDNESQKIGDVLISDSIIPYNIRKVGKIKETPRGTALQSSRILSNIFRNLQQTWEHLNDKYGKANIEICPLLSGEELIDNIQRRTQLTVENPTVRGGEMEGIGLASACNNKSIHWILVKGICDFADGNKGQDKQERQEVAARSALDCCRAALSSEHAFDSLGIKLLDEIEEAIYKDIEIIDYVLFDFYDSNKAKYYIERNGDSLIHRTLLSKGMWVFGESGVGKTTALLYNLLNLNKEVILINLACCVNFSIEDFFNEIYNQLISLTGSIYKNTPAHYTEYINAILSIIDEKYPGKEVYIIVEEIPLDEVEDFKNFVQKFCALIITKEWKSKFSKTKFVLSSINSPVPYILMTQQKVKQIINFYEMPKWSQKECLELTNLIIRSLRIDWVFENKKDELIEALYYSPRRIKAFFRNAIILEVKCFNDQTIGGLIEETNRQF